MNRSAASPHRAWPRRSQPAFTTVVIVGGGHAGLAMSRCLTEHCIDHVVLERGEVANSWRTERWDSLRLLTPNWLTRLPGQRYSGADPDGFMSMPEVVKFIDDYAGFASVPVRAHTSVERVSACDGGYQVDTSRGNWRCRAVVMASGAFSMPSVPAVSEGIPAGVSQITPKSYRNPDVLPDGGVMVVGASATGLQLADEIHRSGRPVTMCVGEHVRMPRSYRGFDIQHWMQVTGLLDEKYTEVDEIVRARRVPSPQLVGTPERATLDLNRLTDQGVELIGRFAGVRDGKAQFSGGLKNNCAMADLKMDRLCRTIDEWIDESGDGDAIPAEPVQRFDPTRMPSAPRLGIDLRSDEIRTIVWATGYRPDYSWLDLPVFDRKGRLRHDGGVVDAPGLYALGLTFMRRRKSSFIHGAEDDCRDLAAHLSGWLAESGQQRSRLAV